MAYRKVFDNREHAMQQKRDLELPSIYTRDDEYYYKSQTSSDNYFSDMEEYTLTEETSEEIVKEEPDHCKIYRFIPTPNSSLDVAPIDHNYNVGLVSTLYPKRTFVQGELQKVEWHSTEELNDIILSVDIVYERDSVGFASKRITTRTWYREDGTAASPTKISKKSYSLDMISQIEEGQRRRGNLIKGLQIPMVGLLLATVTSLNDESEEERTQRVILLGRKFLADHKKYFTGFIEDSNREIIEEIEMATEFWMENVIDQNGTTIRQYILNELNIGGIG